MKNTNEIDTFLKDSSEALVLLVWLSSHTDQVNTISISFVIGYVMSQMRSIQRNSLAGLGKDSDIVPDNFLVSKGSPSVQFGFSPKLIDGSIHGSSKERLARHRVVKGNGAIRFFQSALECASSGKVSLCLGIATVIADSRLLGKRRVQLVGPVVGLYRAQMGSDVRPSRPTTVTSTK